MKIDSHWPLGLLLLAGLLAAPSSVLAAESYDNCTGFVDTVPATISTQGTWCLRDDLSTSITSGAAITIATNNVTLDCNNFKIGGLAAGAATAAEGVRAASKYNATIRNCSIRGFLTGVFTSGGGGHLVENNSFDGNTYRGIYVTSGGSTIRGNSVVDTGLSSVITTSSTGIYAANGVDIIDNTVNGLAASGVNAYTYGIRTSNNGNGSASRNRVRGLSPSGTGEAYGIYNTSSGRTIVRDNDVQGNAGVGSLGIRCQTNAATARDNVIAGFETSVEGCLATANTYNTN